MSTRIMPGVHDYAGSKIGTLDVGQMMRRSPEPVYSSVCRQCGAHGQSITQRQLRDGSARCRAAICGKVERPTGRDVLREQKRIAAERVTEAERAALEASAARMEAECAADGWERPTKYAPAPTEPDNLTERQRIAMRERREAEEGEQREADAPRIAAERAAAERIAELQEEQETTLRQLHSLERERVANGKDEAFEIDSATVGDSAAVPASQLNSWHKSEMDKFLESHPDYLPCSENVDAILSYLHRQAPNLKLVSAVQLDQAYKRLSSFGLLVERPAPATEPKPAPQYVNLRITESPKPAPKDDGSETGIDWLTGEPLTLTKRQIAALSADDYRRFKQIVKADLELPNVGPNVRRHAEA